LLCIVIIITIIIKGATENAKLENGEQEMQCWKMREKQVTCTFIVDNVNTCTFWTWIIRII